MILLASLAAALTVFVGVYALATPARARSLTERLNRLNREADMDRETLLSLPFTVRVGKPAAATVQKLTRALLPSSAMEAIERRLIAAGEPVSLFAFLVFQSVFTFAGVLVALLALPGDQAGSARLGLALGGLLLAVAPIYWLRIRVSARRKAVQKALPDALDLIVTTVEAGMSLDAALAEVGAETPGPLGEELRIAVRETTLGRGRREALLRLSDRVSVPDLRTFIQAIIQAEQTGIPIGPVLRTQANQMRVRKRQYAEAEAQRAPVKMVIVLVLLVLPVMIMLVLGPALIRMNQGDVL